MVLNNKGQSGRKLETSDDKYRTANLLDQEDTARQYRKLIDHRTRKQVREAVTRHLQDQQKQNGQDELQPGPEKKAHLLVLLLELGPRQLFGDFEVVQQFFR